MATIGDNIKKLREAAGMTQEELAKKSGISKSSITHYETGKRIPKFAAILSIANALNVQLHDIDSKLTREYTRSKEFEDMLVSEPCEVYGADCDPMLKDYVVPNWPKLPKSAKEEILRIVLNSKEK